MFGSIIITIDVIGVLVVLFNVFRITQIRKTLASEYRNQMLREHNHDALVAQMQQDTEDYERALHIGPFNPDYLAVLDTNAKLEGQVKALRARCCELENRPVLHGTFVGHDAASGKAVYDVELPEGMTVKAPPPSVTCSICHMTSYNKYDVAFGYCGNCHDWTSPMRRSRRDNIRGYS